MNLHDKIVRRLAKATARNPVDVKTLYSIGDADQVQEILLELLHSNEAQCCLITKRGRQTSVWWCAGNIAKEADWYGIRGKK